MQLKFVLSDNASFQKKSLPPLSQPLGLVTLAAMTALFLLVALGLIAIKPWGDDIWNHIHRTIEVANHLENGQLWIKFTQNSANGKSLATFVYYSPWIYLLPALLTLSFGSALWGLKLTFLLLFVIQFIGCYQLFKTSSRQKAIILSIIFCSSNYALGNIFQRAAFAEFFCYSTLPLTLYLLRRSYFHPEAKSTIHFIISLSILFLSHPLSAMNASLLVAFYSIYLYSQKPRFKSIIGLATSGITALLLTAHFWLPAILEKNLVGGDSALPANFQSSFLTLKHYFGLTDARSPGIPVLLLLTLAIGFGFRAQPKHIKSLSILALSILIYTFLMSAQSVSVWDSAPILKSNVFAWRLLYPMTLAILIFSNHLLDSKNIDMSKPTAALTATFILGLALTNSAIQIIKPSRDFLHFDIASQGQNVEHEMKIFNSLEEGWGISEYIPTPPAASAAIGVCTAPAIEVDNQVMSSEIAISPKVIENGCVRFNKYWNPRYHLQANGNPVPLHSDANRLIVAFVPENAKLTLLVQPSKSDRIGAYTSLISLIVIVIGSYLFFLRSRKATVLRRSTRHHQILTTSTLDGTTQ